jgi:hypothetical protein
LKLQFRPPQTNNTNACHQCIFIFAIVIVIHHSFIQYYYFKMFSANENIVLRQHKKRIVDQIEATIPEHALDLGTSVMVMQVACPLPGCVPLETAVIIIFPKQQQQQSSSQELIPGIPESGMGGNYKTKILKPMAEVTQDDVLDALPPAFTGGRRTMARLCLNARDVMIAQITQLFGGTALGTEEETVSVTNPADTPSMIADRQAMAEYLQLQLQKYIAQGCRPPEWGVPYPEPNLKDEEEEEQGPKETQQQQQQQKASSISQNESSSSSMAISAAVESAAPTNTATATLSTGNTFLPATGNFVVRRPMDQEPRASTTSTTTATTTTQQLQHPSQLPGSSSPLS